jgi:hypothetical protein
MMTHTALAVLLSLSAAAKRPAVSIDEREEEFGAVVGPAVLPAAASSAYAYIGVPEIGVGYRYGLGLLEFEARGRLDWRSLSLGLEALLKISAFEDGWWELAPFLGVGLGFNTGATYLDRQNFSYVAVRILGGMNVTYRVADTVYLLGALELTGDLSVSPGGASRFTPLIGGGAEFYLSKQVSLSALGLLGVDVLHRRPGETYTRLGYGARVGLGFRLF